MSERPLADALEDAFRHCCDMDASLNERLQSFAGQVRRLNPGFADAVDRLVTRLQQSEAGRSAPHPGEAMPPFQLPDENGRLLSLDDLLCGGPVAVTFHRGHWCPYCRLNVGALAAAQDAIEGDGGRLVAIVPDQRRFADALKTEAGAGFPVLTDMDNGYALSLNLAIWVGAEMEGLMATVGCDVPAYQGNSAWMLPIPATFVVGTDGKVKARFIDPDYRNRMPIEALIAALRAAGEHRTTFAPRTAS